MRKLLFHLIAFLIVHINVHAQTVYITNTGEKYHISSCHYLRKSKTAIELKDALAQGYAPCKVCKPPTQITEVKTETKQKGIKTTERCKVMTNTGNRCLNKTSSSNGKCWQHGGN